MNTLLRVRPGRYPDPARVLRGVLPRAWTPAVAWVDVQAWRVGRQVAALTRDERGQAGLTSEVVRTALVVALTLLVVGVILWRAIVGAAEKTAADIEGASNWSP